MFAMRLMAMRKPLIVFILLVSLIALPSNASAKHTQLPSPNDVIALINEYRQQNGIAPLTYNPLLADLAQRQSNYQADISTVTHTGPDGSSPQERATAAGYGGGIWFYLSEIIYGGMNATPSSALSWWKNSSLHNSIMLDAKYTEIGAGVATDGVSTYFTAELGGPTNGSGATGTISTQLPTTPGGTLSPTEAAAIIMPVVKSTPGPDGSIRHIVQQGQTLWTIAAIYNTTPDRLIELNALESSYIFPGDDLLISIASDQPFQTPTPETLPPTPVKTSQPETAPFEHSQITPRLGTPFSMVIEIPEATETVIATPTLSQAITNSTPVGNLLNTNPIESTLVIAAVVILVLVILASSFMQKKPGRPERDDLVN
jgi:LysM repeat protein